MLYRFEEFPLSDGDTIRIGRVSMTLRVLSRVVSTESEEERRGRS